jgi:spore germination cell wall hydrolase CwlJ-like protein
LELNSITSLGNKLFKFCGFVIVMLTVTVVTQNKLEILKVTNEAARQGFVSVEDRTRQLACLTKNIYWESASEPFEGKVAVAQVTMNRVASGKFAPDVCGVVYQKNMVLGKEVCQFSWMCDGSPKIRPIYPAHWKESEEVAKKVLLEGFRLPSLKTALYFHADYVKTQWGKPQVAKIGRHIFYGDKI